MTTLTLEPPADVLTAPAELLIPAYRTCDFRPCARPAVLAVAFRGEKLECHSHVCKQHVGRAREYYDIVASAPTPCPWPHLAPEEIAGWYTAPKLEV